MSLTTSLRLRELGLRPGLLYEEMDSACLLAQMQRPAGFTGLGAVASYSWFRSLGIRPDLLYEEANTANLWAAMNRPSGLSGLGDTTPTTAAELDRIAHELTLKLMHKYGGGAVLSGSTPPARNARTHRSDTTWRWSPQPGGMCGPHACRDVLTLDSHPWVVQGDDASVTNALGNFLWYSPPRYDGMDTQGKPLGTWDDTGGVFTYAVWLLAAKAEEGSIPRLPFGYVTDFLELVRQYVLWRQKVSTRLAAKALESTVASSPAAVPPVIADPAAHTAAYYPTAPLMTSPYNAEGAVVDTARPTWVWPAVAGAGALAAIGLIWAVTR